MRVTIYTRKKCNNNEKTIAFLTLVCLIISLCIASVALADEPIHNGCLFGSDLEYEFYMTYIEEYYKDSSNALDEWESTSFDTLQSILMALRSGRIDVIDLPDPIAQYIARQNPDLSIIKDPGEFTAGFRMCLRSEDQALNNLLTEAIDQIKQSGELDKLYKEWVIGAAIDGHRASEPLPINPDAQTVVVAFSGDVPPIDYVSAEGVPSGFNVEMLRLLSSYAPVNFEVVVMDGSARFAALSSGRVDALFWTFSYGGDSSAPLTLASYCFTSAYFETYSAFLTYDFPAETLVAALAHWSVI